MCKHVCQKSALQTREVSRGATSNHMSPTRAHDIFCLRANKSTSMIGRELQPSLVVKACNVFSNSVSATLLASTQVSKMNVARTLYTNMPSLFSEDTEPENNCKWCNRMWFTDRTTSDETGCCIARFKKRFFRVPSVVRPTSPLTSKMKKTHLENAVAHMYLGFALSFCHLFLPLPLYFPSPLLVSSPFIQQGITP